MTSSKKKPKHPNRQQLADFVQGKLRPNHQAVMEKHLESCELCIDQLDSIKADTLENRLLTVGTHFNQAPTSAEEEIPAALLNHSRYEIIERIGSGGMGEVYRARQRSMDRLVAIKVLRPSLFSNDRAIARFHNEIKVAARLNHPNIVHSYDAEITNGLNILVMELVDGSKLSEVVFTKGPFSPMETCRIAIEVAEGLQYADSQGMIHRDIKPQNLMLMADGTVKITDFGLAKLIHGNVDTNDASLTNEGEVFGTPDYIAPEQIRNASDADRRSDIYCLGCTIYFMLTGRPPFANLSVGEKLAGHLEKQPTSLRSIRPNVPEKLIQVVERMMSKHPDQRFQSYGEVIDALEPFRQSDFVEPSHVPVAAPAASHSRSETAPDLTAHEPSSKTGTGIARRTLFAIAALAFIAILLSLLSLGILPNPFAGSNNPRSGKIKVAIVIPAKNAYFPEVQGFYQQAENLDDVEIEFLAEKPGRVSFSQFNRNGPPEVQIQRTLNDVSPDDFDAVLFTGAWDGDGAEDTRYAFDEELNQQARQFALKLLRQKKGVGSVCGGTIVLANAGLIQGKNVANCRYIGSRIKEDSGAKWSPMPATDSQATTVIDGLIVTGGNAVNCEEVFRSIVKIAQDSRN